MLAHDVSVPAHLLREHADAPHVFIARDGQLLDAIAVADRVRTEAREAVRMLTARRTHHPAHGRHKDVAREVARELGITELAADLLPEDKREFVARLVASGRTVVMVGHGVNDAAALIEAQVGVAIGSGTDVARESDALR